MPAKRAKARRSTPSDYIAEFLDQTDESAAPIRPHRDLRFHAGSDDLAIGQMLSDYPNRPWALYRLSENERWPLHRHAPTKRTRRS